MSVTEMNALHGLLHTRLTNLLAARQLFRSLGAEWTVKRWECEVETRALLRLARQARRTAAAEPDAMTRAKGYRDWTEAEMAYAAGR